MFFKKKAVRSSLLLCVCVCAVGVLTAKRALSLAGDSDAGIAHVCFGDMDLNFRAPKKQRSIWVGEHDGLKLKGCTYEKYGFESVLPGRRFVVAGTNDRQTGVLVYVDDGTPAHSLTAAVAALKKYGFSAVEQADVGKSADNFALLNGAGEQLQVIAVPYLSEESMLLVVRTPAMPERRKKR